ncbi:MAG: hypothetical protein NVS1B4_01640 [Gemmatimonadaceae bacterium]
MMIIAFVSLACSGKQADKGRAERVTDGMTMEVAAPPPPGYAVAKGSQLSRGGPAGMVASVAARQANAPAQDEPGSASSTQLPQADPTATPLIIRTGTAVIEVDSIARAADRVRQLAQQLGGYVANSSVQGGREQVKTATFQLKIPAAAFDRSLSGLAGIGKVESVNVTADDVSEEFVDVTARVANARRLESRLVELLAKRTGKLQDILAVERELARVREQVERYEGRLRFLKTRAAVSTLTVTIHEPYPVLGTVGRNPIADAFKRAWNNAVHVVVWLIEVVGGLIPIVIIVGGLGVIVLRWWKRRSRAMR